MSRRHRWARAVGHVAVVVAVGAVATAATTGAAATVSQDDPEERVRELEHRSRELEFRSRELTFRSRALDNSERVEEEPEQTSITLAADVLFEYDRADLTAAANTRLDEMADQLSDLGPRQITIGGHTDSNGDPAYNQDLSERRAEAVQAALESRLGNGFSFEVSGYGETEPVAPNENDDGSDNPAGRALNRRVVISFRS
jgi:OOP family OmpA-OmpF porin